MNIINGGASEFQHSYGVALAAANLLGGQGPSMIRNENAGGKTHWNIFSL